MDQIVKQALRAVLPATVMTGGGARIWAALVLAFGLSTAVPAADTNTGSVLALGLSSPTTNSASAPPRLRVSVDPRVELMSLLFRLAGNNEYNQGKVAAYTADVEKQFNSFRDHRTVQLARKLRTSRGIGYDAPMSLAVQMTDARQPEFIEPLSPWPLALAVRWKRKDATNFLAAARQFVQDSGFNAFVEQHQALYNTTAGRMQALMDQQAHLEWFEPFFGEPPQAGFTVVLGLLNGGCGYGPSSRDGAGHEERFCILGVWDTDKQGLPVFKKEMVLYVVHEFCHSYANPIIFRHRSELASAGKKLFRAVADQMRAQAYGEPTTMFCESLVRASVIRYLRQYRGPQEAEREIREQQVEGFLWMQELSDLLGQYEAERDHYPTLESFAPRLVEFFNAYAKTNGCAKEQQALERRRPQVVSVLPANGAKEVDPGLKTIQVVFDRPMNGHSNFGPREPRLPKATGRPRWEAHDTTWALPVTLKPDCEYRFYLNPPGENQAFRSEEGVPLKPVLVKFKTRAEASPSTGNE